MKPFKVERTPESSPDVGRKHNFWRSLISDLIYKKKIRELVYNPLRGGGGVEGDPDLDL